MTKLYAFIIIPFMMSSCDYINSIYSGDSVPEAHEHSSVESYYTCSMHPEIKESEPGKCPICHMNLTKVEVDTDDEASLSAKSSPAAKEMWQCKDFPEVTSEKADTCPLDGSPMIKVPMSVESSKVIAKVKLRKSQLTHFQPDIFPATTMKMEKEIRLLGTVLQSEEKESKIPAKVDGRVEKVFVKSTGSSIKKGDPVVLLYSPKLITAGEEYLIARKSYEKHKTNAFKSLLIQSQKRLIQWGIKPFQYQQWFTKGSVPRNIIVYSSFSGVVRKKNAVAGKYFKEGQNFFELTDLSNVWVEMDVYEQDASLVRIGQNVSLEFISLPGEKLNGAIDFVNPVLDTNSRTLKIRTTIKNTAGRLRPGMVAEANLTIQLEGTPIVVPRSAVIDTGKRKVVWTKVTDKIFQAKTVLTGYESHGYVEVKSGVMEGEPIVVEGNFLLDAQAQLFGGYEDFKGQERHH